MACVPNCSVSISVPNHNSRSIHNSRDGALVRYGHGHALNVQQDETYIEESSRPTGLDLFPGPEPAWTTGARD